jgi:molybdopterin-guanine dinucleotide biosynthesis protein A
MDRRPAGLILCGGKSERLGGIDKPLRALAGRALIAQVIECVAPQVERLIINANRNAADYRCLGYPLVDDGAYIGCGPLAGVLAGLAAVGSGDMLCVPGDAPALPRDLAARLLERRGSAAIAYADDGSGPQPLCCLLRGELAEDLHTYLDGGGRTPREWFAAHAAIAVDFSEAPRWAWSINTAEEWTAAESQLNPSSLATRQSTA